ncbi:hypothetical protein [Streptomyces vinaceus]|uniref:hypothetical protein n=1 Tax=Streptomyces vinaceus TaxID=1960 RepID=UPI00367F4B4B
MAGPGASGGVGGTDETLDLLDTLLDGVSEPRLKLISTDEARALIVLLGLLEEGEQGEVVRRAAGDMHFRLGSRLA